MGILQQLKCFGSSFFFIDVMIGELYFRLFWQEIVTSSSASAYTQKMSYLCMDLSVARLSTLGASFAPLFFFSLCTSEDSFTSFMILQSIYLLIYFCEKINCSIPSQTRPFHKLKPLPKGKNKMVRGAATQQAGIAIPLEI